MTDKLEVRNLNTGEIVHDVDVSGKSEAQVERIMSGLLINMDTDNYCIDEIGGGADG